MKGYYVTMQRQVLGGVKTAWLLGPFPTHELALAQVDVAATKAEQIDPWMAFDARGTTALTTDKLPPGKLNQFFPQMMAA